VNHHFISFVEFKGCLYELDGCKKFPINHGEVGEGEFLAKACEAAHKFMLRDPEESSFNLMALGAVPQ
jgi:ubiquitin carboxyl-terminal hydrolase L3